MASYKLITENRGDLYYKKYEFKVTFYIPHIGRTRYCNDVKSFKNRIAFLRSKGWISQHVKLTKQLLANVENYFELKKIIKDDAVRLDMNTISICSNDLSKLEKYAVFFKEVQPIYKKANVNLERSTLYFKRTPPTTYRVYFKYAKVSNDFHKTLHDLIERYENTSAKLYPSKSLKAWINHKGFSKTWIRGNFSIGYNNESDFTILSLTIPEALGANYKLEKSPEQ